VRCWQRLRRLQRKHRFSQSSVPRQSVRRSSSAIAFAKPAALHSSFHPFVINHRLGSPRAFYSSPHTRWQCFFVERLLDEAAQIYFSAVDTATRTAGPFPVRVQLFLAIFRVNLVRSLARVFLRVRSASRRAVNGIFLIMGQPVQSASQKHFQQDRQKICQFSCAANTL